MTKKNRQLINTLIPVVVVIILISLLGIYFPKENITQIVKNSGVFAPIVYILINLITFIIAPLSGTPVTAIGYYLFGSKVIIYGFFIEVFASTINFWISRIWGIKLVSKLIGKDNMEKLDDFAKEYGLVTLFISRFFLRGFIDVISYAAGLTSMKFTPYIIVSIVASVPGTILLYYLSSLIGNVAKFTVLLVGLTYVFLMVYLFITKYQKKRKRKSI